MENLTIAATKYTPEIILDANNATLTITGKSYPENTFDFYHPVVEWINDYFKNPPATKTVVNMEIIYFNSSSSKLFFDLFDIFEAVSEHTEVEINWIYDAENETAEEAGQDFIDDFDNLVINLIQK